MSNSELISLLEQNKYDAFARLVKNSKKSSNSPELFELIDFILRTKDERAVAIIYFNVIKVKII